MTSRSNPSSLILDAFYVDEFGIKNEPNNIDPAWPREFPLLSKNKFTTVTPLSGGGVRENEQSLRLMKFNKANPRYNHRLSGQWVQNNIPSSNPDEHLVWVYLSQSTIAYAKALNKKPWDKPVRVSILYGVGSEMNRLGLRSAMEVRTEPSALVLVPGIEPMKDGDPRWGIGIDEIDLRNLLETSVGRAVNYQTKVIAAFSTGANGLNQTLLHNLIDISHVERVIFYDCLYEQSSGATADALKAARRRAGLGLKVVVYKCTTGGNSLDNAKNLSVVMKNPELFRSEGIVNLFYPPGYAALITYRVLESGIADGIVTLGSPLQTAFDEMKRIVPARGQVVSQASTWTYVHGGPLPSNKVLLSTWYKNNAKVINQFSKNMGTKNTPGSIRNLIWANRLPGWSGGKYDGAENHDLLLPDFGWEYLPL
ncbi:hypothetical protein ES895_26945 [Bacillus sp. 007/AIA-02/001]|uniref:hypothetical protein n=1 Tax=Bacillus sp. 007/AIA-02/001 TaxID=2509009 RepID=UPI0010758548|nr:hypothetical protein [Bacillus sp. 007/AIA-02/001]TFW48658.1 hypothetical protein ES895_26945 [Bacillus sp. 007/AIA-02/001]